MKIKQFAYFIALFVISVFVSCKDKNAFVINGDVDNPKKDVKTAYLLGVDSSQTVTMPIIDSAVLNDQHHFLFKHAGGYPAMYKLLIGGYMFDIIAKNGDDITFKTNYADSTNKYQINGSEDTEKIREYNKINNFYAEVTTKITNDYGAKIKSAKNKADSDALLAYYLPKYEKNISESSKRILKFVNDNNASLAGFFAAKSLDRFKYEQQLVAYADVIKYKFPGNLAVDRFLTYAAEVKPVSVGHTAPDFTLIDIDDKPVKLSDYHGKYIMIDFWASWCQPCRKENPNVVKMYKKFKDKGLNILSISLDDDRQAWLKAIEADKLTWRHASEFKKFDGPVEKIYRIEAIPSNFIINPQGIIVAKNIVGTQLEDFLNKTFSNSQHKVK